MTKSLTHHFVSAIADGADATIVRPSNWNADHDFWLGTRTVSGTTDTIAHADHFTFIRYNNATGVAASLPAPTGGNMPNGWTTTIKNVGIGASVITGTGGATVNGSGTLTLNQNDVVQIFSDGTSAYAGLVTVAPVASGLKYVAKSANYTIAASDNNSLFELTGNGWTLSLPAVASVGAGFSVFLKNTGVGTVTVAPNGSEQIDGVAASTVCLSKQDYRITCNGTAWIISGRHTRIILAQTVLAAAAANVTFALPPDYVSFEIDAVGFAPSQTASYVFLQLANDGVPTFIASANYYSQSVVGNGGSALAFGSTAAGSGLWAMICGTANSPVSNSILKLRPGTASAGPSWVAPASSNSGASGSSIYAGDVGGSLALNGRATHVRLYAGTPADGSTFAQGTFTLFGDIKL